MKRAVIIGNSGGGKSALARRLSSAWRSPHVEIDALLWQPGWQLTSADIYNAEHARLIARKTGSSTGWGGLTQFPTDWRERTDIVVVDMPLWMHFWLAAERQIRWSTGGIENPPAGLTKMHPRRRCSEPSGRSIKTGCRRSAGSSRFEKATRKNGFFGSARLPNSTSFENRS